MVVIRRWECRLLEGWRGGWLLVYGRRKTGKTWLLRRCFRHDAYVVVTRRLSCLAVVDGRVREMGLVECLGEVGSWLSSGWRVVLDEFQRVPEGHWDRLALHAGEGLLAACGSSMGIVSRVFGRRSPLLGLLEPLHVDIAAFHDAVASLSESLEPLEAVEWGVYARDPWILAHIEPRGDPAEALAVHAPRLSPVASGLVGEVFEEEERSLTRLYEATLRLVASGVWSAAELAARLYEAGLVDKPSASTVTGILKVLSDMGLVEKVPLWRTRRARVYHRIRSSLLAVLLWAGDVAEETGLPPSIDAMRSRHGVELAFNIGEMLAAEKRLRRAYSILPDGRDIDAVLLSRSGSPEWGYEVKRGEVGEREAAAIAEWLRSLGIHHAGLVALRGAARDALDEAIDAEELVRRAKRLSWEWSEAAARGETPSTTG